MSLWSSVTWDVARAGGLTAYVLLSLSLMLGLALSVRWQSERWPRLITNDLHRFLTLLTLVFVAVHGLASWLDPFMRFGWAEIMLPLMSHYRPLWMALGIVAGYLALAVWISTELRPRIGYAWWRRLHSAAFAVYVLATVHGLATGSDTRTTWALAIYGGSVLAVAALLACRLLTPIGPRGRTYPNLAGLVALLLAGGVVWTASGPAQAGWNAIANNGQGSGARGVAASASPWSAPFTASVQGTLRQNADAATGALSLHLTASLSGGAQGTLEMVLQGEPAADSSVNVTSGQVTLSAAGGAPRYQGALQGLRDDGAGTRLNAVLQGPGARTLAVQVLLQVAPGGQVVGTMQGN